MLKEDVSTNDRRISKKQHHVIKQRILWLLEMYLKKKKTKLYSVSLNNFKEYIS